MDFVIFNDEILDIKNSEKPKNIKKPNNSWLRNYWNKTKYIWLNNNKNIRERWVTFKRIIHGYNYWKESKNLELANYR